MQEYFGEQRVARGKYSTDYGMLQGVKENVSSAIEKEAVNKEFDSALAKLKEGHSDEQIKAFEGLCELIRKYRFLAVRVNVQKVLNLISEENVGVMCYALQIIPIFFQENELLVRKKKVFEESF